MPTKILWTEETWNPVVGCSKVSPGCDNCYAERMAGRLACMGQIKYMGVVLPKVGTGTIKYNKPAKYLQKWNGKTHCDEKALEIPLHWRKPRQIFVCSMGDLFHESVPFEFISRAMDTILECPQHTFQILTKRPERMRDYFLDADLNGDWTMIEDNVWLGVTAENQEMADKRIPILLQIPAAVRFVSIEPMLGAVKFSRLHQFCPTHDFPGGFCCSKCKDLKGVDWVIVGGESGPGARFCEQSWPIDIVEQCRDANVPCFVKQVHDQKTHKLIKSPKGWPRQYPIK